MLMKQRCEESAKVNSDEASPVTALAPSTCTTPGPSQEELRVA